MRIRTLGLAGLVAATVLLALPDRASAQSTASLRGRVTDEQAGAVADAQITVRSEATGQERTTVSDRSGDYLVSAAATRSRNEPVASTRWVNVSAVTSSKLILQNFPSSEFQKVSEER